MAINKKLIHFNSKDNFSNEVANGNILDTSIVFIKDSKEIYTHGNLYKSVNWSVLEIEENRGTIMFILPYAAAPDNYPYNGVIVFEKPVYSDITIQYEFFEENTRVWSLQSYTLKAGESELDLGTHYTWSGYPRIKNLSITPNKDSKYIYTIIVQ